MENLKTKTNTKEKEEVKYLGGKNYTYEKDSVEFEMKEAVDVTKDILPRIGKSYQSSIKKILTSGRYYPVELKEGYTVFGQTKRLASRVPEIGFIARLATEEKNGKGYNDYVKEFKENKINFDGKSIPQFIDTIEDVKKQQSKKADK